jgi:hypothetical protein
MRPPSRKALEALAFIEAEIASGRKFPRRCDIARHLGWASDSPVSDLLANMSRHGLLDLVSVTQRSNGWIRAYVPARDAGARANGGLEPVP